MAGEAELMADEQADARRGRGAATALALDHVTVWEWDARTGERPLLLDDVDWRVAPGEQWAVLGPNGAGKSTLLAVAAGLRHPSRGAVRILGERVGRVDLRELRARIGYLDLKLETAFPLRRTALEVTLTGATGSIALLPERLHPADRERAIGLLHTFGCARVVDHAFASCSQGERRRVLLARALMHRPRLLLLDEPADGLDLPGREALLAALAALARDEPGAAVVTVTHHLEELPASTTHALLLRGGRTIAAGAAETVLADEMLSACFDAPVVVRRDDGRWSARAAPVW
jgi:iron complex transport system ATP-binding protein